MEMIKYIYVITPTRQNFCQWCEENGYHPSEKGLVFVHRDMVMLGRNINEVDEIHYFNVVDFDMQVLDRINYEIKIRSWKCGTGQSKTK